eukprot:776754-Prorocentrum_minimum.AAC.4
MDVGDHVQCDLPDKVQLSSVRSFRVTFDIGADGILEVQAKDRATAKKTEIKIAGASTLAQDEVRIY